MKQQILDSWQENVIFSMISQVQIMMLENEVMYNAEV